ncbi:MAG: hypothetical protein C5S49_00615 [Candidatus Methanogaster sp.]|nr:MAG: hypothetical protein C5S49_00615 [ANME-2 cluster archaeon]
MQNYTPLQETISKLFVEMDYIAIATITRLFNFFWLSLKMAETSPA